MMSKLFLKTEIIYNVFKLNKINFYGCPVFQHRCYGDNVTYTDWKKDNYYHTIKGLIGDVKGKVGLEYDHVSKENFPKFQDIWPKCEIVDVGK